MMRKIFNKERVIAFICFIGLSFSNITQATTPKSDFVLLVYMNGSNLESEHKLATHNIQDMAWEESKGETDGNLTILLLMGGTRKWHLSENMPEQTVASDSITYITITREGFRKIRSLSNRSIGTPSTLTEFINYGMQEFPADRYGLIFWNHGAGSVTGFGYDEWHPTDSSLSLAEIRQGLQESCFSKSAKFAFIGFDACLMATLETASAISPYADYLVASQELEPGKGWDYKSILRSLRRNPQMPGEQIGRLIVDSFVDSYEKNDFEQVTLSVTDLKEVNSLTKNVGRMAAEIHKKLRCETDTVEHPFYKKIVDFRTVSKSFGMPAFTYHGPDMVDLMDFCQNMGKETSVALLDTIRSEIQRTVIYKRKCDILRDDSICGLSVYFPCFNLDVAKNLSEYQQCGINQEYLNLVNICAKKLLQGYQSKKITDIVQNDSTLLSTEMLLNLRKIYAVVLAFDHDKWITYGLDGDGITLDPCGRIVRKDNKEKIIKEWDRQWISIGGKTVSAYMSFSDTSSLTYTVPVYLNHERADLILRYDRQYPSGKVYGARKIPNPNIPDKGITEIQANDTILVLHEQFEENGPEKYMPSNDTIIVKKKKDMKVRITPVANGKYRFGYCLVDLYGRKYYTLFTDYEVK